MTSRIVSDCLLCQANGFYGSSGVSGRLPEGYTLLEQRFMRQVRQAGLEWPHNQTPRLDGPGVQLNEWEREGWTYHAKGSVSTLPAYCAPELTRALKVSGYALILPLIPASRYLGRPT